MASLVENLIDVLGRECDAYDVLLELSEKKRKVIVGSDLEELGRVTDEEQKQVAVINRLDRERSEIMDDIANVLNLGKGLKLADLIKKLDKRPEEARKLAEAHDKLKSTAQILKMINEQNGELIQNSLDMIRFEMNLIQSMNSAPETANYNSGAYSSGYHMGVTSQGFDAKQ